MPADPRPDPVELLTQARREGGEAVGQLLEPYRNYLTLLARLQVGRRLQGKVDASDLVQETFMEAHRDFARFRGTTEGELMAWLRQILATNLAVQLDQSSQALDCGLVDRSASPSEKAARRERAVLLADALEQLPPAYREVLILRHLEEMRFPEVARRMGRTLDSVKNLWVRALAQVRDLLGEAP